MRYLVAVFRSRTQVLEFVDYMHDLNANCSVIATPKEAKIGCGVSAKFPYSYLNVANSIIKRRNLTAFYGFFLITKNGNRTTTVRI